MVVTDIAEPLASFRSRSGRCTGFVFPSDHQFRAWSRNIGVTGDELPAQAESI